MQFKVTRFLALLIVILFISNLCASMSRGTEPGSFYYSTMQYSDLINDYYAVFYTPDNGETFIRRYFYTSEFFRRILSDAQPGVIYLYNWYTFDVSYDFGNTWQFVEEPGNNIINYTSGCKSGEIYKWDYGSIYRSENYGNNYEFVADIQMVYCQEVGTNFGEYYILKTDAVWPPSEIYYIGYSNDYGASFSYSVIDSCITDSLGSSGPFKLFRGTESGELYLVTLNLPYHYCIYFSTDYGQTFDLKYQGEDFDPVYEYYNVMAGNEPGSFYLRKTVWDIQPDQTNVQVTFFHSTDYAETFTEGYYHYFDDTFENPDYIIPYPSYLDIEFQAGNIEFNIASNIDWWIECEDDWVTSIIPISGSGDETINLNYEENTSNLARTAEVIISGENCEPEVVTIYQSSSVGINENQEIGISNFRLSNYPNPFYLNTTISLQFSNEQNQQNERMKIEIYNVKGQKVKQLVSASADQLSAGQHSVVWNGNDESGKPLNSGIYLYKLIIENKVMNSRKMLLIK